MERSKAVSLEGVRLLKHLNNIVGCAQGEFDFMIVSRRIDIYISIEYYYILSQ